VRVVSIPTYRLAERAGRAAQHRRIAGTRATAEPVAAKFEADIERLRDRYSRERVLRVFIQIDDEPLYTVNRRHVISEVSSSAAGRNVFADCRKSPRRWRWRPCWRASRRSS